jgi:phosphopentomutase
MGKHVVIIVLDGVGHGALPDAADFGDEGSDTLGNLAKEFADGLNVPHMAELGLGNTRPIKGVGPVEHPTGGYGRMREKSRAKDTTLGHWEIAGVPSDQPFPTFPQGFPPEFITRLEQAFESPILGNYAASGTEIIQQLGDQHVASGHPIVYTSADSVLQIACHEETIPLERLYQLCEIARGLCMNEFEVGRIIARPFIGTTGQYRRTRNRRDFSVFCPKPTLLDVALEAGYHTVGIGKISDIFAHRGLSATYPTKSNEEGILSTLLQINEAPSGVIFTNLIDTDMLFGHRRDKNGFRSCLEHFDGNLPHILKSLGEDDLLFIVSDHGNDPTFHGTDHTREHGMLLVWSRRMKTGVNLGDRPSFADVAETACEYLELPTLSSGATSFLKDLYLSPSSKPGIKRV